MRNDLGRLSRNGYRVVIPALLGVCLAHLLPRSNGLAFEVNYGGRKCIYEDVPPDTQVTGEFHVSGGTGDMDLDLYISDPRGVVYYHKQDMKTQRFSFTSGHFPQHETQDYKFCVLHQVHYQAARMPRVKRRVSFSIKIGRQKGSSGSGQVATGAQVDAAHERFGELETELDTILGELDEIRNEEQLISDIGKRTTRTILGYSLISIVITILTGFLNHYYLRFFFKQKKLM